MNKFVKILLLTCFTLNLSGQIELNIIDNECQLDEPQKRQLESVIRLAINLPSLQQYFHINDFPDRKPLIIKEFGWINAENLSGMSKFGVPIQFMSEEDIRLSDTKNYIVIRNSTLEERKSTLQLEYPVEGITVRYVFIMKLGQWELLDSQIFEN